MVTTSLVLAGTVLCLFILFMAYLPDFEENEIHCGDTTCEDDHG